MTAMITKQCAPLFQFKHILLFHSLLSLEYMHSENRTVQKMLQSVSTYPSTAEVLKLDLLLAAYQDHPGSFESPYAHSCWCCSVTKSGPTLWYPVDSSMTGFRGLHYLQEFAHTHVHWVGDAIKPSHPLSPSSPPALNFSHHQGLLHELALHIRWPKYWSFSFSISPSSEYSGLISFRMDSFALLAPRNSLSFLTQTN